MQIEIAIVDSLHPIEWVVKAHELTILQPVQTPHHAAAPAEGGSAPPSAAAVFGGGVDGQEPGVSCADAGEQQGSLGCIYYTHIHTRTHIYVCIYIYTRWCTIVS